MCVSMLCQRTIPGLVQASASPMKLCFHLFVQSLCQGWQATKKVILLIFSLVFPLYMVMPGLQQHRQQARVTVTLVNN